MIEVRNEIRWEGVGSTLCLLLIYEEKSYKNFVSKIFFVENIFLFRSKKKIVRDLV